MKLEKTHPQQMAKVKEARKQWEINRSWELWEKYRGKLAKLDSQNLHKRGNEK